MMHPACLDNESLRKECVLERGKSSGPGGQNRNKVSTMVTLTHTPTGVVAQASERRSGSIRFLRTIAFDYSRFTFARPGGTLASCRRSRMLTWPEARYRLLHDDRYLDAFLARDTDALALPPELLPRLLALDSAVVMWDARGARREMLRRLRPAFDAVFERWATYMGDDARGTSLVTLFLRSDDHRRAHTGEVPLHTAFRAFLRRTGVFPEGLLAPPDLALAAK